MRRPVMYLAGLLLATGASLALAGPASAAPAHPAPCHHHGGGYYDDFWGPDGDDISNVFVSSTHTDVNSHNSWSLLSISGLLGNGGITPQ